MQNLSLHDTFTKAVSAFFMLAVFYFLNVLSHVYWEGGALIKKHFKPVYFVGLFHHPFKIHYFRRIHHVPC